MAPKEIILDTATGTRLIEVRRPMPRGLSVSRYLLTRPGNAAPRSFASLRKARAAFEAQTSGTRGDVSTGTHGA